jgi:hypothetical protein
MVPTSSTPAQSQAAQASWLSELRRWLLLGRNGVIVMIRDAQRPRMRELVLALDELEPGYCFTDDVQELPGLERERLVLLPVRREDLDWLNLNRPIFADRSLRVVLWAEGELATQLKFSAPDLHDWISHFVTCPRGVPKFAVQGLEMGLRWWPGAAWSGENLDLALEQLTELGAWIELDPATENAQLVEMLEADPSRSVIWRNVSTATGLWRLRWAIAESRHHGLHVLDNPTVGTPGWLRVSSSQLDLPEAAAQAGGEDRLRRAALAELEPGAFELGEVDDAMLERVGLLRGSGPEQRMLHESERVRCWRRELARKILRTGTLDRGWSRDEQAMFAWVERDRMRWPDTKVSSWMGFTYEHGLRTGADPDQRSRMVHGASWMGQYDVAERWRARWEIDVKLVTPTESRVYWGAAPSPVFLRLEDIGPGDVAQGKDAYLTMGPKAGWDMTLAWQGVIVHAMVLGERTPADLPAFLDEVSRSAIAQLGATDPHAQFIARILGLASAVYDTPARALAYLDEPSRLSTEGRLPLLTGADLEASVVLTMLGRYEAALDRLAHASTTDPEVEEFHHLTRAAQGVDRHVDPGENLFDVILREGKALLRRRLARLGNITLED